MSSNSGDDVREDSLVTSSFERMVKSLEKEKQNSGGRGELRPEQDFYENATAICKRVDEIKTVISYATLSILVASLKPIATSRFCSMFFTNIFALLRISECCTAKWQGLDCLLDAIRNWNHTPATQATGRSSGGSGMSRKTKIGEEILGKLTTGLLHETAHCTTRFMYGQLTIEFIRDCNANHETFLLEIRNAGLNVNDIARLVSSGVNPQVRFIAATILCELFRNGVPMEQMWTDDQIQSKHFPKRSAAHHLYVSFIDFLDQMRTCGEDFSNDTSLILGFRQGRKAYISFRTGSDGTGIAFVSPEGLAYLVKNIDYAHPGYDYIAFDTIVSLECMATSSIYGKGVYVDVKISLKNKEGYNFLGVGGGELVKSLTIRVKEEFFKLLSEYYERSKPTAVGRVSKKRELAATSRQQAGNSTKATSPSTSGAQQSEEAGLDTPDPVNEAGRKSEARSHVKPGAQLLEDDYSVEDKIVTAVPPQNAPGDSTALSPLDVSSGAARNGVSNPQPNLDSSAKTHAEEDDEDKNLYKRTQRAKANPDSMKPVSIRRNTKDRHFRSGSIRAMYGSNVRPLQLATEATGISRVTNNTPAPTAINPERMSATEEVFAIPDDSEEVEVSKKSGKSSKVVKTKEAPKAAERRKHNRDVHSDNEEPEPLMKKAKKIAPPNGEEAMKSISKVANADDPANTTGVVKSKANARETIRFTDEDSVETERAPLLPSPKGGVVSQNGNTTQNTIIRIAEPAMNPDEDEDYDADSMLAYVSAGPEIGNPKQAPIAELNAQATRKDSVPSMKVLGKRAATDAALEDQDLPANKRAKQDPDRRAPFIHFNQSGPQNQGTLQRKTNALYNAKSKGKLPGSQTVAPNGSPMPRGMGEKQDVGSFSDVHEQQSPRGNSLADPVNPRGMEMDSGILEMTGDFDVSPPQAVSDPDQTLVGQDDNAVTTSSSSEESTSHTTGSEPAPRSFIERFSEYWNAIPSGHQHTMELLIRMSATITEDFARRGSNALDSGDPLQHLLVGTFGNVHSTLDRFVSTQGLDTGRFRQAYTVASQMTSTISQHAFQSLQTLNTESNQAGTQGAARNAFN